MMVDNFGDWHPVCAIHSLREFVMVNEDKLSRNGLQEIALGEDPAKVAMLIEHGKGKLRGEGQIPFHLFERRLRGHGNKGVVEHLSGAYRAARQQHRRGCVVRRTNDYRPFVFRSTKDRLVHLEPTGDNDRVHVLFDRELLDILAITNDEDHFPLIE